MSNEPKFKVGDRVRVRANGNTGTVITIDEYFKGRTPGTFREGLFVPLFWDHSKYVGSACVSELEHVLSPTLADLIAEKEALIDDIEKQLKAAKQQLEALTTPKVGDRFKKKGSAVQVVVLEVFEGRVYFRCKHPYDNWVPAVRSITDFSNLYERDKS